MSLTAAEQFALELVNRARLDPLAEAASYGINLNAGLAPGTLNGASKQVLAPNALLHQSAESHGDWLLASGIFSHDGAGGSTAHQRMVSAGYSFTGMWMSGENLAVSANTAPQDPTALHLQHHRGLFESASHRVNLLDGVFRETGISESLGSYVFPGTNVTYRSSSMLVQNFALSGSDVFVTGVAYTDRDRDGFYSIGEGAGNIRLTAFGQTETTAAAGGYALALQPNSGMVAVSVQGAGSTLQVSLRVGAQNAKLDVVNGTEIKVTTDAVLTSGVTQATLLGLDNLNLTGGNGNETLIGNAGANSLQGGNGNDVLRGGAGNDVLRGDGGNDTIYAGTGNDNIGGGAGNDIIYGESGANIIWAGLGNDTVQGGSGNDTIYGSAGNNRLLGNNGNDLIYASADGDFIGGGAGNDSIYGGDGVDTIYFGAGNDFAGGGAGNDILYGGLGDNRFFGGLGNDTLVAGTGKDIMTGSAGADVFVFESAAHVGIAAGRDIIADFTSGTDKIDLSALSTQYNGTAGLLGGGRASFYHAAPNGLLIGDQNGDGRPDWVIELQAQPSILTSDFLL